MEFGFSSGQETMQLHSDSHRLTSNEDELRAGREIERFQNGIHSLVRLVIPAIARDFANPGALVSVLEAADTAAAKIIPRSETLQSDLEQLSELHQIITSIANNCSKDSINSSQIPELVDKLRRQLRRGESSLRHVDFWRL